MALEAFIPKIFTQAHKQLIKQANAIIEEYAADGYRLTLRALHYQFVARDLYENTQAAYKRLGNVVDAARKAGLINWDAIEDRTRGLRRTPVWDTPETALERLQDTFKLDPWNEQPKLHRIEVWIEKDAVVGIVEPTCNALRLPYFSCRGYSSSSALYESGKRLKAYKEAGYETLVLYLGDHDPSGVQMTDVSRERVDLYAGGDIEFRRIALTPEQIEQYSPPPNFVKETDSRTKWYVDQFQTTDCWELDALSPRVVDALIRSHVEPLIDQKAWDATMAEEIEHKRVMLEIVSDWNRTKAAPAMADFVRSVYRTEVQSAKVRGDEGYVYPNPDSATLDDLTEAAGKILDDHSL